MKDLRREYSKQFLEEDSAGYDPFQLFQKWFEEARENEDDANAMSMMVGYLRRIIDERVPARDPPKEIVGHFHDGSSSARTADMIST